MVSPLGFSSHPVRAQAIRDYCEGLFQDLAQRAVEEAEAYSHVISALSQAQKMTTEVYRKFKTHLDDVQRTQLISTDGPIVKAILSAKSSECDAVLMTRLYQILRGKEPPQKSPSRWRRA
jgi:uncharacterized tellurite resistance protein B-like protein